MLQFDQGSAHSPFVPSAKIHDPCTFPITSSFFFNDTATTEIYTLSLHDALPISILAVIPHPRSVRRRMMVERQYDLRSEEHTSELQSRLHLVCRLLLEKKNTITSITVSRCWTRCASMCCPLVS